VYSKQVFISYGLKHRTLLNMLFKLKH